MNEDSKKFRNAYGNLYRSRGGPELVNEEEIKKALKLRENRTDTKLSKEEIKKIRRKFNFKESLINGENEEEVKKEREELKRRKAREELIRRKAQARRASNDRERDD